MASMTSSIATGTMSALVCRTLSEGFDGAAIETVPRPEPGPGQVRVRVRAASLNFPDLLMLRGAYQYKPEPPFVCGMDFAGVVDAVGPDAGPLLPGARVAGGVRSGAFAEYVCVPSAGLALAPDGFSDPEAAAYPAAYTTAHVSLIARGRLMSGETLLVHGASGGVGMAAIDVGRLLGARVLAVTGSPAKVDAIGRQGADHVILTSEDVRQRVLDLTAGQGANVIFDPVGGDMFDLSTRCIAFDGRLLVVGFAGGRIAEVKTNIPLIKGFSVVGVRAGEYGRRFPEEGRRVRDEIWRWAAEGRTRPLIHAELKLSQWKEAYGLMRDRALCGKIVLAPDR
jgi:NADPH2:quinone reductase